MDINSAHIMEQNLGALQKGQTDRAVNNAKQVRNIEQIDQAAKEFEAVYISQMLGHMFDSIETDKMFGGGQAEEVYKGMMVQEYGKLISEAGGLGLADTVKAEMIKMQEGLIE